MVARGARVTALRDAHAQGMEAEGHEKAGTRRAGDRNDASRVLLWYPDTRRTRWSGHNVRLRRTLAIPGQREYRK